VMALVLQLNLPHIQLPILRHTEKQTNSKSWQTLTKKWEVLRGVTPEHVGKQSGEQATNWHVCSVMPINPVLEKA
jgi:hypothetical protein